MLHLRTDWQGIQDLRQDVLPSLNQIEIDLYAAFRAHGIDQAILAQLSFAIDRIALAAGATPHQTANRLFPAGSSIQPEEPVFVVRAKDPCCVASVQAWAAAAASMGCDPALFERVMRWADEMRKWQEQHNPRPHAPDAPSLLP